ncbi:MAG: DUF3644 domain-containing protein [Flavobacteriales bacterium]|nr:DUF3644 domain-containing protein [Flavobacteriales bacterium]
MTAKRILPQQEKFYEFLKAKQKANKTFTLQELADATGYKLKGTINAKISRHEWDFAFEKANETEYRAKDISSLTFEQFFQLLSTKKTALPVEGTGTLGHRDILLNQAKDNFILSLELYNRPSLENRFQAFTLIHCAAWEHLLKAAMIKKSGTDSIFSSKSAGRTKGLDECAKEILGVSNKVYLNLSKIIDLRNTSAHLILPELGGAYSPIFQASVINFTKFWNDDVGYQLLPSSSIGLMSLTTGHPKSSTVGLQSKYGKELADEIKPVIESILADIEIQADNEFAIVVNHKLRFAKAGEEDFTLAELIKGKESVNVIKEFSDHSDELLSGNVIEQVNDRLNTEMSLADRVQLFRYSGKEQEKMNTNDWLAICHDQQWIPSKGSRYCRPHGPLNRATYTIECVHWIISKFKADSDYLLRVKGSYMEVLRRKKAAKLKSRKTRK